MYVCVYWGGGLWVVVRARQGERKVGTPPYLASCIFVQVLLASTPL